MNPPPLPIYALPHPPTGDADARAAARVADGGPAFWQAFYLRHGARFFKDRHWLGREFEELGAATTLLEVGCGVGNAARPLAALCPGATVYACDYAAEAVRLLAASPEAREGRVVPFVADAAAPGALTGPGRSPPGGVDVATLVFVLSAVEPGEPMRQVVRNVATALRRDGKGQALVRDYCAGDLAQARLAAARGGRGLGVSRLFMRGDGTRAYYFYPEELVALFEGEGFRCESVRVVDADRVNRAQGAVMRRKWVQATFTLVADSGQCAGEDAGEAGACGGPSAGQGGTATVAGAALLTRLLLPAAATADGPTHLTPPGTGAAPAPPSLNKLAPLYRAEWEDSDDGSGDEGSSDGSAGAARAAARLYRDIQGGDGSGEDGAVLEQQYVDVGPPLGRLALVAVPGSLRHTTRHTGLLLWGAAPSLGRTLLKCPQLLSRGPVIELGAGASPAVMLAALRAGAPRVVATDGSVRALRVLERNVRVNASLVVAERARLRHLPWGDPTAAAAVRAELAPAGFDVVLGADVLYSEAAVPRLLASLACLLAPGGVAVLCYQERGVSGRAALAAAAAAGLAKVQPPPCLAAAADSAAVGGAHLLRLLCLCRAGEEDEGGA